MGRIVDPLDNLVTSTALTRNLLLLARVPCVTLLSRLLSLSLPTNQINYYMIESVQRIFLRIYIMYLLRSLLLVCANEQWIVLHRQMRGMQGMRVRLPVATVVVCVALSSVKTIRFEFFFNSAPSCSVLCFY